MICFNRIDEKLIHGQVATTWIRIAGANRIYIVDDVTAHDAFIKDLFKSMAPQGTRVEIWDVEMAKEKVKLVEAHEQIKGMILCKGPLEFLALAKAGIHLKELNVGNMTKKGTRRELLQGNNTYADLEERNAFRELVDMGVNVYVQMIPDRPKTPILSCPGMNEINQ